MAVLRKSSNKPMPSFLHKVIRIGIATALGGISFIIHPEYVAAQEDHHSPKNTTTPQPRSPTTSADEYIEHFKVPTLTTKEFIVERLLNQGLESLSQQNMKGALQKFNQALLMNPNHERAYRMRGDLLRQMGDNRKAIDDYTQAIKKNPNFSTTYVSRGEAYEAVGKYPEAIEDYTKALELYPEDGFGYSYRGAVYSKLGENQKAIADLNKAIELNPSRPEAYLYRGNFHAKLGDMKKASENEPQVAILYQKAIADYHQAAKLFSEQGYMADSAKTMNIIQALQQRSVPVQAIQ